MAEHTEIQQLIKRAVGQALEGQLPRLQADLVQCVLEALPAPASEAVPSSREDVSGLVKSVAYIHAGTTQKEILRALLTAGSERCSRIALFVVKAGAATGWQSRGFGEDDAVKDVSLDMSTGLVARAYQDRVASPGNVSEIDSRFVEQFGRPANQYALVLPLVLKEKVAALVYADGGDRGTLDTASLELLVLATSAWLEVTALRKQAAQKEAEASAREAEPPPPAKETASHSDPFAGHTPKHRPPSVPSEPEPAVEVVQVVAAHG
ncbi:MAG: GAF domain-containing protein, partial [Candidatus Sulfotelmatobacter sp.]